jgi:CRP-like cAMP-binding protein
LADDQQALLERELFLRALLPSDASRPMLKQLAAQMRAVEVPTGGVLYSEGTEDGTIRFLVRGEVELSGSESETIRMPAPAILGMFDIILRRPHSRTARAVTDISALWLRQQDWFDSLEDNFEAALTAVNRSSETLLRLHLDQAPLGGFVEPQAPSPDDPAPGLNLLDRTLALRAVSFLEGATVHVLSELAQSADEIVCEGGTPCFAKAIRCARSSLSSRASCASNGASQSSSRASAAARSRAEGRCSPRSSRRSRRRPRHPLCCSS